MFSLRRAPMASLRAVRCAASATPAAAVKGADKPSKMQVLHKILTGEASFKNKALTKHSYVCAMFGEDWKKEFSAYTAKLPDADKKIAERQMARLELTRYTTRELAMFAGNGPAGVDAAAKGHMLCEGVKMLNEVGEDAFVAHVKKEASMANWSDTDTTKFISECKAFKK